MGLGVLGLSACGDGSTTDATSAAADSTAVKADAPKKTEHIYQNGLWFGVSLAQWSLHKALYAGELTHLDFIVKARRDFEIGAVDYVNSFFKDKAADTAYLKQMNQRASDNGVRQLLIMIDGEGDLGNTNEAERKKAVENHYKWIDCARYLGCHSIRVNAAGKGTREAVASAATDGLGRLSEYAANVGLNVIVENHGGYSSDANWLTNVIENTGQPNCGTLPDFGNFCIEKSGDKCINEYDRYEGVKQLMPYAHSVSAKTYNFNEAGEETLIDYRRMMKLVREAGYNGYVGVEYEGNDMADDAGIKATQALLIKVGKELM